MDIRKSLLAKYAGRPTPKVVSHMADAILGDHPEMSKGQAFAIATSKAQEAGYLHKGTHDLTNKGRKRSKRDYGKPEHFMKKHAMEKLALFYAPKLFETRGEAMRREGKSYKEIALDTALETGLGSAGMVGIPLGLAWLIQKARGKTGGIMLKGAEQWKGAGKLAALAALTAAAGNISRSIYGASQTSKTKRLDLNSLQH